MILVRTPKSNPIELISELKFHYPNAHCALHFRNPFELLVATILSAQCTDARVNQVTPALFERYANAEQMSQARILDLEKIIHSTGFYKNKAKNLKAMATCLIEKHRGQVPESFDSLVELPGVGRKTAHVVMGNAFQIPSGIVVDTHVQRLSYRLGLVRSSLDPVKMEQALNKKIPREHWIMFSHWLIAHGRSLCKARGPKCASCFLCQKCPRKGLSASG